MFIIKKKILIVLAILIFSMPFQQIEKEVHAAVGKVVNTVAKKIAKEAIAETAVKMSVNMMMEHHISIQGKTPKPGHVFTCLPADKQGANCTRPMQMKQLDANDKKALKQKVSQNLDKKIMGGVGATRWGKFLNWIAPVFAVGMGFEVLDYAINGDVSDLFDDIAWDALVDEGFIINENENTSDITGVTFTGSVSGYNRTSLTLTLDNINEKFIGTNGIERQSITLFVGGSFYDNFYYVSNVSYQDSFLETISGLSSKKIFTANAYYGAGALTDSEAKSYFSLLPISSPQIKNRLEVTPIPKWNQLNLPRTNPAGSTMKVPAPGAYPYSAPNGAPLLPLANPDGSVTFTDPDGNVVPNDDVVVGEPEIDFNPNPDTNPGAEPSPDLGGFFKTLWDWLSKILMAILGLPQLLINGLMTLLQMLFIPTVPLPVAFSSLDEITKEKFNRPSDFGFIEGDFGGTCSVDDIYVTIFGQNLKIVDAQMLKTASSWYLPIFKGFLWFLFGWYLYRKPIAIFNKTGGITK